MKDLFGKALLDYYRGTTKSALYLFNEYGDPEEIPVETYFNGPDQFSDLEIFALNQCNGTVLDVGAATGRHALYLQEKNIDVTALDLSPACGILMKEAGVCNIVIEDIFNYRERQFDTITMLMNGLGVAGTLERLKDLLDHLEDLLNEGGQLIVDSTDIAYLYEKDNFPANRYFGELTFQYSYDGQIGDDFDWLYIDPKKLVDIANFCGWNCQIIYQDYTSSFLARLQKVSDG